MNEREYVNIVICNKYENYKRVIEDMMHLSDLFGYTILISTEYSVLPLTYSIYISTFNIKEHNAIAKVIRKYCK